MRDRMRNRRGPNKNERRPVIDTTVDRAGAGSVIMRGPARGGAIRRGGGAGIVRFIVFLAVIGAGYWALGTYRHEIIERVPAAYPILKAIGIEVEEPFAYGLSIVDVEGDRVTDENRQWVVYVRGKIRNTSDKRLTVPRLHITVTASNAPRPLTWTVEPELSSLAPRQEIRFQSRYSTGFAYRDVRARVRFVRR